VRIARTHHSELSKRPIPTCDYAARRGSRSGGQEIRGDFYALLPVEAYEGFHDVPTQFAASWCASNTVLTRPLTPNAKLDQ
jgi:hypothetical protein